MTETQVKDVILKGLAKIAPEADLNILAPDDNLREALDIDSYDFLSFLIGLSDDLGVEVPEADYGKLGTLRTMIDYLVARTV